MALKPLKRAYKDLPTVPLNLRDGVVTEKPEKGIKDTDPLIRGHNYAPGNYIESWIAVTEPAGWSAEDTERLKALFE